MEATILYVGLGSGFGNLEYGIRSFQEEKAWDEKWKLQTSRVSCVLCEVLSPVSCVKGII